MIEPLLLSSSIFLGKELLIQTLSKTTHNIYKGLDDLNNDESFEFKKLLMDLDINPKLEIIHQFISEINESDDIKVNKYSKSIDKILSFLIEILKNIENEIENIKKEINLHKKKWFHKLRYCSYNVLIDNLVKHLKILDMRFELLIKLLN